MKHKFFSYRILKTTAWFALMTFISTQTGLATEFQLSGQDLYQAVKPVSKSPTAEVGGRPQLALARSGSLWQEESPLSQVEIQPMPASLNATPYEFERYVFEDAYELLRPEYATAVVLESLEEADVRKLLDLDFEVGIAIIEGETVLFTSGNEHEIWATRAGELILSRASFLTHTHPLADHGEGPSQTDLSKATELVEYVLTDSQAYVYNNQAVRQTTHQDWMAQYRNASRSLNKNTQSLVHVRGILNRFIAAMDRLNEGREQAILWRASETSETLSDGTVIYSENGKRTREVLPSGDTIHYSNDEAVTHIEMSNQSIHYLTTPSEVIEIRDTDGNVLETIATPEATPLDASAVIRMTLENGVEAYYIAGELVEMRTQTGIRITDFVLDEENNILDALITYSDNTVEVIRSGALLRRILPDGSVMDFLPERFAVREILASHTQYFFFDKTTQTDVDATRVFTLAGESMTYDDMGILSEASASNGDTFAFNRVSLNDGGYLILLDRDNSTSPDLKAMVEAEYSDEGVIERSVLEDGTVLHYNNGILDQVMDAAGDPIDYDFQETHGIFNQLQVTRGTSQFTYDQTGFLERVDLEEGALHRIQQDSDGDGDIDEQDEIDLILEAVGGDRLLDFELDEDGNIVSGIVETREGVRQFIQDGVLTGYETADGKLYEMTDTSTGTQATLKEWKLVDGTRVIYGGGEITEILYPTGHKLHSLVFGENKEMSAYVEELEDGTKKYFEAGYLVKLITPEDAEITYSREGQADRVTLADGSDLNIRYTLDAFGQTQEIVFEGNHTHHTFDPSGTLLSYLKDGVSAEVNEDEISKLFTRYGLVDAPEFNDDGELSGDVIFNDDAKLVVEEGELVQAIRSTGTKVNYADGRVASVETTQGLYEVVYVEDANGNLTDMKLNLASEDNQPEVALVPFLEDPETILNAATGGDMPDHPITFHGDAKVEAEDTGMGQGVSVFDGAGDYMTIENSDDFQFGTDNWTLDFFVQLDQQAGEYTVFKKGNHLTGGIQINRHAGINRWDIFIGGNNVLSVTTSLQTDAWHHMALVREDGLVKLYQDGVMVKSISAASVNINNTEMMALGSNMGMYHHMPGRLDEIRWSHGARWSSDFVPPSEKQAMDAGTMLYADFEPPSEAPTEVMGDAAELKEILLPRTLHNTLADRTRIQSIFKIKAQAAEGEAHAFTLTGDAQRNTTAPAFGDSSLKVDGAGDYMTVDHSSAFEFGEDDWTVDFKVRFDAQAGEYTVYRKGTLNNGGIQISRHAGINRWDVFVAGNKVLSVSSSLTTGAWHHLALVRHGNNLKLFQDGVEIKSVSAIGTNVTSTEALSLGSNRGLYHHFPGSIDELHVSKGIARYTSNFIPPTEEYTRDEYTSLLLHFSEEEFNASSEILPPPPSSDEDEGERVYFAKMVMDGERGDSYEFAKDYMTEWLNVSLTQSTENGGYLTRGIHKGESDSAADVTSQLIDMDGDGLRDRIMTNGATNTWWFERNNGQGFEEAVEWSGVNVTLSSYTLRETAGPHPIFVSDLKDMNGDGKPDRILTEYNSPMWYVQLNNGSGFDVAQEWDEAQVLSFYTTEGKYAVETRYSRYAADIQDKQSALIDLDGDGLLDRVVRPVMLEGSDPADHWFFQRNNGNGFDPAVIWEGVDWSFYPMHAGSYTDDVEAIGASLSWYHYSAQSMGMIAGMGDIVDMDGDGLPDRVLLKHKVAGDAMSGMDWYVQFNNGSGFDEAVLWDSNVRELEGTAGAALGTSISLFDDVQVSRRQLIQLVDVTGDGLPDRVTLPSYSADEQSAWWVEVNDGNTFLDAVEWTGIDGIGPVETAISQDTETYRLNNTSSVDCSRVAPCQFEQRIDLVDINGDNIPDRVLFRPGETKWIVQFGTGSGFLPAEEMKIAGLAAEANQIRSSRYDHLHVSLKSAQDIPASLGKIKIEMGKPEDTDIYQTWELEGLTTDWQDFYLPLDTSKLDADEVKITFVPNEGEDPNIAVYVDNMTFTSLRPPAVSDWLDRMLTEDDTLSEVYSNRTQTLAGFLGVTKATDAASLDWNQLLSAETRIDFDAEGEVEEVEKLIGSVTKLEDGNVVETILEDGTKIEYEAPDPNNPHQSTQTITTTDGETSEESVSYGRVRSITASDGSTALEYSYEFTKAGDEITVAYDPETSVTERYGRITCLTCLQTLSDPRLLARTEANGVQTEFTYNALGEQIKTEVTYKGRVRQTYLHEVADSGNRIVVTDAGVREEYSEEGEILFTTTADGYRYEHQKAQAKEVVTTYETETITFDDGTTLEVEVPTVTLEIDPDGEEVHSVSLVSYTAEDGSLASYSGGDLTSLTFNAEGSQQKITLSFDAYEAEQTSDTENGSVTVKQLKDATVFHEDGTVTEFKNGLPYQVVSATGRVISLEKEQGEFINPNESAVFHYNQAIALWVNTVQSKWNTFQLEATHPIVTEFTSEGELVTRQMAEGSRELYNEDGKIELILSGAGERLISYDYDENGNPILITYEGMRRQLESSRLEMESRLALEREHALAFLAEREQVIDETVEGEYRVTRDNLLSIRAQLQEKHQEVLSLSVIGRAGKTGLGNTVRQIQVSINQVNAALVQIANQRAEALENLTEQVQEVNDDIEGQTEQSLSELDAEVATVQQAILTQELSPVIYHAYRDVLGRDASEAEYESWINSVDYELGVLDVTYLKTMLGTSDEFYERSDQVKAIKTAVENQMNAYLAMTEAEKQALAESLGITLDRLVSLSEGEVDGILDWLLGQSLHFGQSAYLSLEAMLEDALAAGELNQSTMPERVSLATDLILIDILTGTLTPLEEGDLVLSMYALGKVAEKVGLTTHALGLNYVALKSMYDDACASQGDPCDFRMVAHINHNHYIIVTSVTDEEVTYTDPGMGPEDALQQTTLTKDEFLLAWLNSGIKNAGFGTVLSPRAPPAEILSETIDSELPQARYLDVDEQMQVRGAFFGFLKKITKFFAKVFLSVTMTGLYLLSLVSDSVDNFLNDLERYIELGIDATFDLLTFDFSNAWDNFKEGFKLGLSLATQALNLPFALTADILIHLGVPEHIALTISDVKRIITGTALLFIPGGQAFGVALISQGTTNIATRYLDLSPEVAQIVTISAAVISAFAGGLPDPGSATNAFVEGLKAATPVLAKELAAAGVVALGDHLGWDPALTNLLAVGVRTGVGVAGNRLVNRGQSEGTLVGYRDDGSKIFVSQPSDWGDFLVGAIQTTPQELSVNLSQPVEGTDTLIGTRINAPELLDQVSNQPGLFDSIARSLKDAAISAKNFLAPVAYAAVPSIVANFNQTQLANGLAETLKENVKTVFDRPTIENILQTQGGIDFILAQGTSPIALPDGTTVNGHQFSNTTTLLFDGNNEFIGQLKNGRYELGQFEISDQEFNLKDGNIYESLDQNSTLKVEVSDGNIDSIMVEEGIDNPIFTIEGNGQPIFIEGPDQSRLGNGVFNFIKQGLKFVFENGSIIQFASSMTTEPVEAVEVPDAQGEQSDVKDRRTYLLNGIGNVNPVEDGAPDYMVRLRNILRDVHGFTNTALVGLYQGIDFISNNVNSVIGGLKFFQEFIFTTFKEETQKVISKIINDIASGVVRAGDTINVVAYSGGAQRILEAAWFLPVNINLMLYGAPTLSVFISDKIKNIKQIWGSKDPFEKYFSKVISITESFGGYSGVLWPTETIDGAFHTDNGDLSERGYHCDDIAVCEDDGMTFINSLAAKIESYFNLVNN